MCNYGEGGNVLRQEVILFSIGLLSMSVCLTVCPSVCLSFVFLTFELDDDTRLFICPSNVRLFVYDSDSICLRG